MRFVTKPYLLLLLLWGLLLPATGRSDNAALPMRPDTAAIVFSGQESMHYAISWSGGIKIGDLFISVEPDKQQQGCFTIRVRVSDYGLFRLFYPVDDSFVTLVCGPQKLPQRYEVHQKEGRGRETRRLTLYDQEKGQILYRRNNEQVQEFRVSGPVYNEFAAFVITRTLAFRPGARVVVPTFADKKRNLVEVILEGREKRRTIFGPRQTLRFLPRLTFKGLYDKEGDTVIWLSDDVCRIPVFIRSRIRIGSLSASLVEYANPACPETRIVAQPLRIEGD
ncbi:DUF3108 domain-containing protein [Desulfolithobacter sp.]